MDDSPEKRKFEITKEQSDEVQERLTRAEYALELLGDGLYTRLETLLYGIKSHYRVVDSREILDEVHKGCNNPDQKLLDNSRPAGSIISSFKEGRLDIQVYSIDLNQAELLSRSHGQLATFILHAIGLTKPSDSEVPLEALIDALLEKKGV